MKSSFNKIDLSILLGNVVIHFDSALYTFLAPVFAGVFFPEFDPVTQLILAYSILGSSLVTKPVGSFLFGYIANKFGPSKAMSYSLAGAVVGSMLMAIVPGFETLGPLAPSLLILARMIKGLFSEGETSIVKLYIIENKNYHDSYKASYIFQSSSMIGMILASFVSTLVFKFQIEFLWRYCFIFSGVLGLISCVARYYGSNLLDLPKNLSEKNAAKKFEFWQNRYKILFIVFASSLSYITYAIPFITMNSLIPLVTNISMASMMELNTILLLFDLSLLFILGRFLKNCDYIKVSIYSSLLLGCTIPILFFFLPGSGIYYVTFVRLWIILLGVIFVCPQNLIFKDAFKYSPHKYMLVGTSSALGSSTLGRLTPAICLFIWQSTNNISAIAFYITIIAILTSFFLYKAEFRR